MSFVRTKDISIYYEKNSKKNYRNYQTDIKPKSTISVESNMNQT